MSGEALALVVTARYAGAIGYAEVFDCRVISTVSGALEQDRIRLTVLPDDGERLAFLAAHPPPAEIEIGFAAAGRDEPYATAPITGFVGDDRAAWRVTCMREAGGGAG